MPTIWTNDPTSVDIERHLRQDGWVAFRIRHISVSAARSRIRRAAIKAGKPDVFTTKMLGPWMRGEC